MRIMHITLSDPRTHKQGLNRYCFDLSRTQRDAGLDVIILYPGSEIRGSGKRFIKTKTDGVVYWKMKGSLPRALMYGISNPEKYIKKDNKHEFVDFFKQENPDIVHVHSFQGFPYECFEAINELGIKTVFTTHDYFPICPRCNLVNTRGGICTETADQPARCAACNYGKELNPIIKTVLQSDFYPKIKNTKPIQLIKSIRNSAGTNQKPTGKIEATAEYIAEKAPIYDSLLKYYRNILLMMDVVHFNSPLTESIYNHHADIPNSITIPISRNGLDNVSHVRKGDILNVSFLGGYTMNKGISVFTEAISHINSRNIVAHIYGYGTSSPPKDSRENIIYHGEFKTEKETENVWENTDLLIVPSQCPETFGYVTLEALSRNIPVIVSDLVGAGCLLGDMKMQMTYEHSNEKELAKKIERMIDPEIYKNTVSNLQKSAIWTNMPEHERAIHVLYTSITERNFDTEN